MEIVSVYYLHVISCVNFYIIMIRYKVYLLGQNWSLCKFFSHPLLLIKWNGNNSHVIKLIERENIFDAPCFGVACFKNIYLIHLYGIFMCYGATGVLIQVWMAAGIDIYVLNNLDTNVYCFNGIVTRVVWSFRHNILGPTTNTISTITTCIIKSFYLMSQIFYSVLR